MMWRGAAYLQAEGEKSERKFVYCNEKSIFSAEFHRAGLYGLKPDVMLEVRTEEYSEEPYVIYKDVKYVIYRKCKSRGGEITELYGTRKAGEF